MKLCVAPKTRGPLLRVIRAVTAFLLILPLCASLGCENEPVLPPSPTIQSGSDPNVWSDWQMDDGWQTASIDNKSVMEGIGHSWTVLEDATCADCDVRVQFKMVEGAVHFNFRRSISEAGLSRYFIGINGSDLYLSKQQGEDFTDLGSKQIGLGEGWHEIEIRVVGGLINAYVDQTLVISYEDKSPLNSGGVAFETLDHSHVMIRSVEIASADASQMVLPSIEETTLRIQQQARASFSPEETHEGDLVLDGSKVLTIENEQFLQLGNVYINDSARLIIRNAVFMLGRGNVPTVHVYINVAEHAELIIENSTIIGKSEEGAGMLIVIRNYGTTLISDSPTQIHLLEQYAGTVEIRNTEMINEIGGLLQVAGGQTLVSDSTLGALGMAVPSGASVDLKGIRSGAHLEHWDVHDWISEADYELTLENTELLKDTLEPGPYERGWLFFPEQGSKIHLSDSELRKVFINVIDDTASFENLRIGLPSSLSYNGIVLEDIVETGQWPFWIQNADVTISNSDYLFLQPNGKSTITLVNSHVVEFIPREFYGEMIYENCTWTNAGEIIGGEDYHSAGNDFLMTGSLTIAPELREHLQWKDARVTREYIVRISDQAGQPLSGLLVSIGGQSCSTNQNGEAVFRLAFDETNYNQPVKLEVTEQGEVLYQEGIDFFTSTPVIIAIGN